MSFEPAKTLYSPGGTLRVTPRASHPMVSGRALENWKPSDCRSAKTLSPESVSKKRDPTQIRTKDKEHAPDL